MVQDFQWVHWILLLHCFQAGLNKCKVVSEILSTHIIQLKINYFNNYYYSKFVFQHQFLKFKYSLAHFV